MFTGIVLAVGKITAIEHKSGDCRLTIEIGKLPFDDVNPGDSIAVNGVCLTAVELGADYFCADVSKETLACTTLAETVVGKLVNLELALTPSSRLGGHIVSGHVDGLGEVIEKKADARSYRFKFKAPDVLAKYIAEKGSICIDGVSLTINALSAEGVELKIIPHSAAQTTIRNYQPGDQVAPTVRLNAVCAPFKRFHLEHSENLTVFMRGQPPSDAQTGWKPRVPCQREPRE
mgnify:CR=1 FL=1